VKPIEDFIQSRNDPEVVFEAVELLLMKRDQEVKEAAGKFQMIIEKVTQIEAAR
jgi:hypothetical protein